MPELCPLHLGSDFWVVAEMLCHYSSVELLIRLEGCPPIGFNPFGPPLVWSMQGSATEKCALCAGIRYTYLFFRGGVVGGGGFRQKWSLFCIYSLRYAFVSLPVCVCMARFYQNSLKFKMRLIRVNWSYFSGIVIKHVICHLCYVHINITYFVILISTVVL